MRKVSSELSMFFEEMAEILAAKQGQYGPVSGRQTIDRVMEVDPLFPLGAIQKYLERVKNTPRKAERDLLKIATYAYFMRRTIRRERLASETPGR